MKFKQYINEKKKVKVKIKRPKRAIIKIDKARKIIMDRIDHFVQLMDNNEWNVSLPKLSSILNKVYSHGNNLIFLEVSKSAGERKYATEGAIYKSGLISIDITKQATNYLMANFRGRKNNDKLYDLDKGNIFFREIIQILGHELVHKEQLRKYIEIINKKGSDYLNKDMKTYLSDPEEIMAHAQDAAVEIINYGKSNTIIYYFSYFESNHPVIKRLIKLVEEIYEKQTGKNLEIGRG